jgi:dipeptidase D
VALHGHIDMVCKIAPGIAHDFTPQDVKLTVDGHRIRAEGMILGAHDGLGISCILALRDSTDIPHPPLECVMTAMEEMGKIGGAGVDPILMSGKRMIDVDRIDERQLLAGCSGDMSRRTVSAAGREAPVVDRTALLFDLRSLRGGQCAFDIHLDRANAITGLGRLLRLAMQAGRVQIATLPALPICVGIRHWTPGVLPAE